MVGDYLKATSAFKMTALSAVKILRWFGDHPAAAGALDRVQKTLLKGKSVKLVFPASPQWSSMANCLECFSKVGALSAT